MMDRGCFTQWKVHGLGSLPAFIWILTASFISLMTLGQLLNFSVPQFPHLWNRKARGKENSSSSMVSHSPWFLCLFPCSFQKRWNAPSSCLAIWKYPLSFEFQNKIHGFPGQAWAPSAFLNHTRSPWQLHCMAVAWISVFPLIFILPDVGIATKTLGKFTKLSVFTECLLQARHHPTHLHVFLNLPP